MHFDCILMDDQVFPLLHTPINIKTPCKKRILSIKGNCFHSKTCFKVAIPTTPNQVDQ